MPDKNATDLMPDWLERRAQLSPDKTALTYAGERWTFADLNRQAEQVARRLSRSVNAGDRIATLLGNGTAYALMVHAVPRTGGILVPLNVRLTLLEVIWQIEDCRPAVIIYDEKNAGTAADLSRALPGLSCVAVWDLTGDGDQPTSVRGLSIQRLFDLSEYHTIVYTSGSTGRPKGAVLTYGNHWWNAMGSALNLGLLDDDCWLACLPMFHVGGLAILLRSVIYGAPVVIHESFEPGAVTRAIEKEGVTIVSLVPTTLTRLLDRRGPRPFPNSLRCLLVGGSPLSPSLQERCRDAGWPVVPTYGMTESASQLATVPLAEAFQDVQGTAGKPLFPAQVRIAAGDDLTDTVPGSTGSILVRGPTISPRYWNETEPGDGRPEGWFDTGDVGHLDKNGYLCVESRKRDLIISGGENVYPAEVENTLAEHPDVVDAGVVGIEHEEWGEEVAAAVVLREGVSLAESDLIAFCRERIADYKIPRRMQFVSQLPRNAAGKILRDEVRNSIMQMIARDKAAKRLA